MIPHKMYSQDYQPVTIKSFNYASTVLQISNGEDCQVCFGCSEFYDIFQQKERENQVAIVNILWISARGKSNKNLQPKSVYITNKTCTGYEAQKVSCLQTSTHNQNRKTTRWLELT